ncbi:PIG-L family deacetylase [Streptomyces sp. NPDC047002]|uniref:PIG-L family deacetylase n=1 Tax=Streptomyces sp. NPDC047002 TaxID=3155475 RepID=UPI00345730CF
MSNERLTLMAVHAHPDDEASSTGGVLARYAAEGVATVLVTCTDGRQGDGPGGTGPESPEHDPEAVVRMRRLELEASGRILGIGTLETLGYFDSGMMGWSANSAPGSFWTTPVQDAALRLAGLIRKHRPQVLVTYDENGFYGHPDHIQANRVTLAALDQLSPKEAPAKVYWTTVPRGTMEDFGAHMRERGTDWPEASEDDEFRIGLPDDQITTWIDVRDHVEQKYKALASHASQPDNAFFTQLGLAEYTRFFGVETFSLVRDATGSSLPETDLFAGLR